MESGGTTAPRAAPPGDKVILIGNPNVGKSLIFNYLTGQYVTVSNYPGTTVEVARGTMSSSSIPPLIFQMSIKLSISHRDRTKSS